MKQTRREFIVTSTAAVVALSVIPNVSEGPGGTGGASSVMLEGDPYLAFVDDGGLGGHTWDEAREHALRFRSTPEERDRYVLGLEI